MSNVAKFIHTGEIITPDAHVRVVGYAHPLKGKRIDIKCASGLTIEELLLEAAGELNPLFIVHIDGNLILQKNWRRVRVKSGATVTFRPTLMGGGNGANVLKSVLAIAVAVVSFIAAPYLAPGLVAALGTIGLTVSVATATSLVALGIVTAGMMALNALFPARTEQVTENPGNKQLNSVQGAQNRANPYGPIPSVLGRHRFSPYLAANPYTELVGDDQWIRMLFCWGYGPLEISDIRIGETPITDFTDYEIETNAKEGDPELTLFPSQVHEQSLSIVLGGTVGAGPEDDWESRTTAVDIIEISIDITAPEGMYRVNSQTGNLDGVAVPIQSRYRLVGTTEWSAMPQILFQKSTVPTRKGTRVSVAKGQYEVQVRRTTVPDPGSDSRNKVIWTALRGFEADPPVQFGKRVALTALRMKATDQLSGVISTLNGIAQSLVTAFAGDETWVPVTASSNCADLFRHTLQNPANARPKSDSEIDLDNLQEFWQYCVDNGWTFNQIRENRTSVYDVLSDIAAAGRAVPTFIDGKWGVVWDRPTDSIVNHFTTANSWGFSGDRVYPTLPHAWRVSFINADNGWTVDERFVYDDGYDENNATLFEGIDFPGVTDPDLIWKHGRFHIAQVRLRPETYTLQVNWDGLVCTKGDRVALQHDVILVGLNSGRIKSVAGQVVTFDETVTIEDGKTYGLRLRSPSLTTTSFIRAVDPGTGSGEYTELTLVGDLTDVVEGMLFSFGETDQEAGIYRVKGIDNKNDQFATLTLVDDAPEISQADQGEIPEYYPNITIPPDPFTLKPKNLIYQEVVDSITSGVRSVIRLSWQAVRRGKIVSSEVQQRDDTTGTEWLTVDTVPWPKLSSELPITSAGTWSYRVRFLFSDGTPSDWTVLDYLNLTAASLPPATPQNVRVTYVAQNLNITLDEVEDYRPVRYEYRMGTTAEGALYLGDQAHPPFEVRGDGVYWVAAYVTPIGEDRVYSEWTSIDIEDHLLTSNVIVTYDEKDEGWNGTFTGGAAQSGSEIRTSADADFLGEADFLGKADFLDSGGQQTSGDYYSPHAVDIGRIAPCQIGVNWSGGGVPVDADFLAVPDFLGQGDFLGAESSRFVEVYPIIRVAQNSEQDIFESEDIFDETDIFSGAVQWGEWEKYAPGVYVGRFFQLGMALRTYDSSTVAVCTEFTWFVDVPDRMDEFNDIAVSASGTAITFRPREAAVDSPFNGGLNNQTLPHVQKTLVGEPAGYEIVITDLTLGGCTVHVIDDTGDNVDVPDGVYLTFTGY